MDPERAVEQIRADGLLAAGGPVVVLLSGGRDSVCLLDVAVRIAGAPAVSAVHVNYGLRDDADDDERHCAQLCERLGVALAVERPSRPAGSGNLQAWARDVRYAAAAQRALTLGPGAAIATGHTASDQVETILYRLASSPSRRALLGMRPRDGRLVRPLLGLTREETTAYCEARGLPWRDDATNEEGKYARNRLRLALIPALREAHPAAEANVLRLAELLRDEADVLDALVAEQLDGRGAPGAGAEREARATIPLARLQALAPALRRLVVQRLADGAAGRPVAGAARHADAIAALRPEGLSMLDVGGGVRAVAEYGVVRMERGGAAEEPAPDPVRLPVPGVVAFGGWEVRCEETPVAPADGVLDRAALGGEQLLVRPWRPGDRIAPVGLGGTKSLQDLFRERRMPRAQRRLVPVVACGEEVAWVPGVATSARYGVTERTRDAVRLSARAPVTGGRE
ncbi:tRNA lysidine(34) synthetase TilS [Conexibacter woesei]|uniref:tRNA(Ile)-lysidine synthase n=1 Tax=Conexibacter woesei (strain DSM 14684 / CCUG 47730 / CIP 108061 / JCM 11494 / NBRC 100937 / ID131577) TaxID=469383 RepID=D3F122_CONWI|nr:tRNA lysidine(34) synthetase TilS [Conexibacter woesei]ADB50098.1 tRNA(Ile)-lysidine synthetase [Conexibacter woesei DSM 14684]